ncbi:MAG TPA: GldG family protein [Bryobacteraceae bacterium]|nr:GldG family protein [Bryobacteraceae bacterium]
MKTGWLSARQTRYTGFAAIYILVVIGALGLANWLANRHNKSLDTTANRRFSLSDQTNKVIAGLKQDVRVTYFDRTDNFLRAKDLLDRYDTLSTKLHVDYVDPDKKPQAARSAGIRNYGTITVDAGARHEEAKALTEEEVTGAIIRTLKGGERTVCATSGSGERGFEDAGRDGYGNLKQLLERNNYKTRAISLLEKPEAPKDCTVLLIGGPRFDLIAPVVSAIKTYVDNGGRALILLDAPAGATKEPVAENAALVAQLAGWGIAANKDLALDTSGVGQIFGLSEVVPLVSRYESHAIVTPMTGVATAFPLSRTIDVAPGGKWTASKLLSTSDNSYATTNLGAREIQINPERDKKGPLNLAAASSSGNSRVVVAGSSAWVANSFISFNGNRDLFLNMVAWLSSDEELISIRPKNPEDRRLALNRAQMMMIFYTSVLLLPLAIVAIGVSVWWKRR